MNSYADKNQENKSNATANSTTQRQSTSKPTLEFVDNRAETITQTKLQEIANSKTLQNTTGNVAQYMSWKESKSLDSDDYQDPVADGVSGGGVWMYVLSHVTNSEYDIRVHFHAGSSKGSKAWTVRWNNEGSGNNIATQKWMRDRVKTYYDENQT